MVFEDHIGFLCPNPLIGAPDFVDMSDVYSRELRRKAFEAAAACGLDLKSGVYFFTTGPSYETPAEVRAAARLGAVPSFFPAHIKYWGETHISNLGRARAARISPAKSALLRGIPFTLHQDTPVCPPSPLEAVSCAVARRTQSGRRFACQAIDVREALEAVTRNVAAQYGFADRGAIRPGYRADFIVLDDDPLACPPEALASLRAAAVYRDGECVFRA